MVAGLKVGEVVAWASLLVLGIPYHSSNPWSIGVRPRIQLAPAEVPFAEERGGVAQRLQCFGDGDFPEGDPGGLGGGGANRVAAGEQGGAGNGAGELDVEVVEPNALRRDAVDVRGRDASHRAIRPTSPQPRLSGNISTMLGRLWVACARAAPGGTDPANAARHPSSRRVTNTESNVFILPHRSGIPRVVRPRASA